jgi:pyruvate kinase
VNYEIVATLGPSSSTRDMWNRMTRAGVTAFRLNTSHVSLPELSRWLDRLGSHLDSLEQKPPVILDLQGNKWRLGDFDSFLLEPGGNIELVHAETAHGRDILPVPHSDFFRAVSLSAGEIVLGDTRAVLAVESFTPGSVKARVVQGGVISSRKGITFTHSTFRSEGLQEKDREVLVQSRHLDFILYAVSYVKDAVEMAEYRRVLGDRAYVIAKLERESAVDDTQRIALSSDELWLCRGDLGAEAGFVGMAQIVRRFSDTLNEIAVPVLLAGQVLEHMTRNPVPTRSEVCHLYDALSRGYRGLVLSDETAVGRYPEESCRAAAMFLALSQSGRKAMYG